MKRKEVESSNIRLIGYDKQTQIMEIEFKSGGVYRFYGVPERKWRGILRAKSKGKYFHRRIKGEYEYEMIKNWKEVG